MQQQVRQRAWLRFTGQGDEAAGPEDHLCLVLGPAWVGGATMLSSQDRNLGQSVCLPWLLGAGQSTRKTGFQDLSLEPLPFQICLVSFSRFHGS